MEISFFAWNLATGANRSCADIANKTNKGNMIIRASSLSVSENQSITRRVPPCDIAVFLPPYICQQNKSYISGDLDVI